ncbi:unnamed protein product, partial [Ectocarpus fasciculatus]
KDGLVTCGSVIKLKHKDTGHHLHSHAVAWGSGSSQQSVTAHGASNDQQSFWLVKEAHNAEACPLSTAIKCGDKIRLQHVATGKNLHSHLFRAPLSGNQEVSGFGDNGWGDTGDNWEVVCSSKADYWNRGEVIQFKHGDTGKWLSTGTAYAFNQQNCGGGCPIMGQTEVSSSSKKDSKTLWFTGQGIYFPGSDSHSSPLDDEL